MSASRFLNVFKKTPFIFELLIILIISIPTFSVLLNDKFFSMHDRQDIARLYLLDQGIKQGNMYPRWVDKLGFGFGYPLFNFYPPLVYFLAEAFHLTGLSLILSIKAVFILGFILASLGIYLLVKKVVKNRPASFLSATLYSYFFYHAVLAYNRGALAEFFSYSLLPFLFLTLYYLFQKANLKNSIWYGIAFALFILNHPLIATPALFYLFFFFVFYLFLSKNRVSFLKHFILANFLALALSSFFWLPSYVERQYTLIDLQLIRELASYKIHYIYPQQFWYSPWGYGGSIAGPFDGLTFQLGKAQIFAALGAFLLSIFYLLFLLWQKYLRNWPANCVLRLLRRSAPRNDKRGMSLPGPMFESDRGNLTVFYFFLFLLLFSLFMTTSYSSFIWDNIPYLWYLQFPWRFLVFAGFFISVLGGYLMFFLEELAKHIKPPRLKRTPTIRRRTGEPWGLVKLAVWIITLSLSAATIYQYYGYFKPQKLLDVTDKDLTTDEEIVWKTSLTSHEFIPKGVITTKSEFDTTVLDIKKQDLPKKPYQIISGKAYVEVLENKFEEKRFALEAESTVIFRLNTYHFPGWKAYLDDKTTTIKDDNDYRLITVEVPVGKHRLTFKFENTGVRTVGNFVSVLTLAMVTAYLGWKYSTEKDET